MKTIADRLIEKMNSIDFGDSVENDTTKMWAELDAKGVAGFIKNEVEQFVDTHFTNKLSKKKGEQTGFLRGAVYGYVFAKTGDRKFSVSASLFATDLALKSNKETA
jgi:hypothetical protein